MHLIRHGQDPAMLVGLQNYLIPGIVDTILPMPRHPWGKTRERFLPHCVHALYRGHFERGELQRKANAMMAIASVMGNHAACALEAVRFANSRPGEYVAIQPPGAELYTTYFPPGFTGMEDCEKFKTDADQFYFDLSGRRMIHEPASKALREVIAMAEAGSPSNIGPDPDYS
jgi:hypothetical protein